MLKDHQAASRDDSQEFFISEVIGRKIYDSEDRKVGRLKDLAAIWVAGNPEVVGLKITSRSDIIPLQLVAEFGPRSIRLRSPFAVEQLRRVAGDEIFVSRWLLDKQIVDIRGAKVERVNDIKLKWHHIDGKPRLTLTAVDIGMRGIVRRLGLKPLAPQTHEQLLHWDNFKPLTTRTASLELTIPAEHIAHMHPADIADIIQELHPEGQMQVLTSLAPETAGMTLAEVDSYARSQLLAQLSVEQAHPLIAAMDPDDAADNLSSLAGPMQEEILRLVQPEKASNLTSLMRHQEGTAGSLMTSEFIAFRQGATAQELLAWLQEEQPDFETWNEIFVLNEQEELVGVIPLRNLILSQPAAILSDLMEDSLRLRPEDDFGKILEFSVKYDLLALPVVDEHERLLGMVTIDDVLTSLVENPRNRRFLPRNSLLAIMHRWARG